MKINEVLKACTVEGMVIKLPPFQLDRAVYLNVKKSMQLIGGIWKGGNVNGFQFNHDPAGLLLQLINNSGRGSGKLHIDFQYFPTPDQLADQLVELAGIEEYDLILEPSAGQGAIINAIHRSHNVDVHYCELMDINRTFLQKIPRTIPLTPDFLTFAKTKAFHGVFHRIIANPPFSKNQDIVHILAMWNLLAEGGRIVTICSKHWEFASGKKEQEFRHWLKTVTCDIIPVPAGAFKLSGTEIATNILVINKD